MLKLDVVLKACMAVSVFDYMVWTKRKVMHSIVRIERPEQSAFDAELLTAAIPALRTLELLLLVAGLQ